jgi:hypothetical protein
VLVDFSWPVLVPRGGYRPKESSPGEGGAKCGVIQKESVKNDVSHPREISLFECLFSSNRNRLTILYWSGSLYMCVTQRPRNSTERLGPVL